MTWAKVRLGLTALLFVGWVGWLAWQTRDVDDIVVSRSQVAAGDYFIVAGLTARSDGRPAPTAEIREVLLGPDQEGPTLPVGGSLPIDNLPGSRGFTGQGEYLLVLSRLDGTFQMTPVPPSPGYAQRQRPLIWIYRWTPRVREQILHMINE